MNSVEIWVDPICPWAWVTSQWLLEVERLGEAEVQFRVLCKAHLNRDKIASSEYEEIRSDDWKPVRVLTAVRLQFGQESVRRFYLELGKRIHLDSRGLSDIDDVILEALAAANLPTELAATGAEVDGELIQEHFAGLNQVGTDVGTPIISVGGVAFFGPVVTPAPMGEAALNLWRGVLMVAGTPGFYELKRSHDEDPQFN